MREHRRGVEGGIGMAEGLLDGVPGGEEEGKAASALGGVEAIVAAVAANTANQSPEVAAATVAFLRKQTELLEAQQKFVEAEHEYFEVGTLRHLSISRTRRHSAHLRNYKVSPTRHRETEIYRGIAKLSTAKSRKSALVRLFTDWGYATRVMRYVLRLPVPLHTEDRRVLEQVVFPYFLALPKMRRVLFVGCDWYTKHYERVFFPERDYWTIDVSPKARKFGGKQHVVGGLEELDKYFAPGSFDLIFCNGVYGFGLDEKDHCERAISLCWSRLRDGGFFVFGWNDIPARTPVSLDAIAALNLFQRLPVVTLGSWRYVTDTPYRHTYDFYCKEDALPTASN
jgi:hypothetical protein